VQSEATGQLRGYDLIQNTHLLVEDAIAFVDIRDISFVLVGSLPGEFPLLVDTEKRI
jgi:hypothetical protein